MSSLETHPGNRLAKKGSLHVGRRQTRSEGFCRSSDPQKPCTRSSEPRFHKRGVDERQRVRRRQLRRDRARALRAREDPPWPRSHLRRCGGCVVHLRHPLVLASCQLHRVIKSTFPSTGPSHSTRAGVFYTKKPRLVRGSSRCLKCT